MQEYTSLGLVLLEVEVLNLQCRFFFNLFYCNLLFSLWYHWRWQRLLQTEKFYVVIVQNLHLLYYDLLSYDRCYKLSYYVLSCRICIHSSVICCLMTGVLCSSVQDLHPCFCDLLSYVLLWKTCIHASVICCLMFYCAGLTSILLWHAVLWQLSYVLLCRTCIHSTVICCHSSMTEITTSCLWGNWTQPDISLTS